MDKSLQKTIIFALIIVVSFIIIIAGWFFGGFENKVSEIFIIIMAMALTLYLFNYFMGDKE